MDPTLYVIFIRCLQAALLRKLARKRDKMTPEQRADLDRKRAALDANAELYGSLLSDLEQQTQAQAQVRFTL